MSDILIRAAKGDREAQAAMRDHQMALAGMAVNPWPVLLLAECWARIACVGGGHMELAHLHEVLLHEGYHLRIGNPAQSLDAFAQSYAIATWLDEEGFTIASEFLAKSGDAFPDEVKAASEPYRTNWAAGIDNPLSPQKILAQAARGDAEAQVKMSAGLMEVGEDRFNRAETLIAAELFAQLAAVQGRHDHRRRHLGVLLAFASHARIDGVFDLALKCEAEALKGLNDLADDGDDASIGALQVVASIVDPEAMKLAKALVREGEER